MKTIYSIFTIITALVCCTVQAQDRRHVVDFSQFQPYFNPALSGVQGTAVKSYYRNPFVGEEDTPETLFVAGEVNLGDILETASAVQHGFGLSFLRDIYGELAENQLALSYGAGYKLNDALSLRAGLGFTYDIFTMRESDLLLDIDDDPSYQALINGQDRATRYGLNFGIAVTADDYYVGYGLRDAVKADGSGNSNIAGPYVMQHVVQAGYRREVVQNIGVIVNGLYHYDTDRKGIAEGQVKVVWKNTLWLGGGYRQDLAHAVSQSVLLDRIDQGSQRQDPVYTVSAGVSIKNIRIGYSREINRSGVHSFYRGNNELTLSYHFTSIFNKSGRLSIW